VIYAAATSNFAFDIPSDGWDLPDGIVVCNSSTSATKTLGAADCFFTSAYSDI